MERKKRILLVNEPSFLATGYSTYGIELMRRLYESDKYELAELGCFVSAHDKRQRELPWKFYGNQPDTTSTEVANAYNSNILNSFGKWEFERVCLDFFPDVVLSIRDPWVDCFIDSSPFRPYFHYIQMPTVDSIPQQPVWLDGISRASIVFSYSDWGLKVLKEANIKNAVASAPAGVDFNTFTPVKNKVNHRQVWGLPGEALIIGTVMRNQERKLFPDLFESFSNFIKNGSKTLTKRSFLLVHSSYPDWWRFADLLHENEIGHKTLFSYKCQTCKHVFVSFFMDAKGTCPRCENASAFFPNTHEGISREELAEIYNLMDVYVQYANSEGQGVPQVEAGACGIPIMSVDYSAMEDVVRKLGGYPINVAKFVRDAKTGCKKAIPDNEHFVNQLTKFLSLPESMRKKKGFEARKGAETHYNWNNIAATWAKHIDELPLQSTSLTWGSPPQIHNPPQEVPGNFPPELFVRWAIANVLGRPDLCDSFMALRLTRDLQWGSSETGFGDLYFNEAGAVGEKSRRKDFSSDNVLTELKAMRDHINTWEEIRCQQMSLM